MRALITGGGGQLASDLQEQLGDEARSLRHAELDIAMTAEALDAIAVDASSSNRHRSSGHSYAPEQFGLTHADIYEPLKEIFDVYGFES